MDEHSYTDSKTKSDDEPTPQHNAPVYAVISAGGKEKSEDSDKPPLPTDHAEQPTLDEQPLKTELPTKEHNSKESLYDLLAPTEPPDDHLGSVTSAVPKEKMTSDSMSSGATDNPLYSGVGVALSRPHSQYDDQNLMDTGSLKHPQKHYDLDKRSYSISESRNIAVTIDIQSNPSEHVYSEPNQIQGVSGEQWSTSGLDNPQIASPDHATNKQNSEPNQIQVDNGEQSTTALDSSQTTFPNPAANKQ